ncbi:uncharacterized protein MELLADRAFT_85652 [Melampsora larici-populina 98AG31]|uniref:Uncharacterized protein n=1 Tax=Melampsora larici-populina (strain 98AG31 / pathotype 3-4-7) TaxID=747676 RepID=F4RJB4_MELLP|nr:uncharacterized protein MELLADRAFT_85652 [Melampsora larici-populina 98AG31]EGG07526.1 hypothetical protein MELLADRAFT_85652 [Melampsora larici-populina 98AG31]
MYSLPTKDQARLLNRFLRDCEVLQDHLIDSLTGVDLEDKDLKGKASSRASKFKPNRTENEEADKLAENNPKEEETVDDSQKQPASKTEQGDCNKTKKKHGNPIPLNVNNNEETKETYLLPSPNRPNHLIDIDTENIDTENHTRPAFNKQDEVIKQPYHPPTRSDCSSPSHQAEELLILNALTPKRAKARLHIQSNPTKRDAGQHSSSYEDHSTTDSTRPKPQTIEDQVPTIDTTTQNTSLLLPSNVGSTSAVNPSSPLPFVEEFLNNLPTKEQSATLPPKEQSKPNDNTNTLQCEISKEDNQSIPLTNDAVPSKNSVKSRKRKATDVTRQPTRVSARRKAAESKKESDFTTRRSRKSDNSSPPHLDNSYWAKAFGIGGQSYTQEQTIKKS